VSQGNYSSIGFVLWFSMRPCITRLVTLFSPRVRAVFGDSHHPHFCSIFYIFPGVDCPLASLSFFAHASRDSSTFQAFFLALARPAADRVVITFEAYAMFLSWPVADSALRAIQTLIPAPVQTTRGIILLFSFWIDFCKRSKLCR